MNLLQPSALRRAASLSLLAAASLLAVTGCHKKTSGVNPASLGPTGPTGPAPTASLTVDPAAIDQGQSAILNWRTTGADTVSIDGIGTVPSAGTRNVTPQSSTIYHLTANGPGGATEATVQLTVRVPVAPTMPTGSGDDGSNVSDSAFHAAVQDAFFDYDSAELNPQAQQAVSKAAAYLTAHPAIKVLIGGYCDDRGSAEYNLALGQSRANAAKAGLVQGGVAPSRIRTISYGKEKQFCTEENETCWQENRRAQFTVDR